MDLNVPPGMNDLSNCSSCFLPFDYVDRVPKLLNCRHYFCLKCVKSFLDENGVRCLHCWNLTKLPEQGKAESLITNVVVMALMTNSQMIHLNGNIASASFSGANNNFQRGRCGALYERRCSTSDTSLPNMSNDTFIRSNEYNTLSTNVTATPTDNSSSSGSSSNTLTGNLNSMLGSGNYNIDFTERRSVIQSVQLMLNEVQNLLLHQRDLTIGVLERIRDPSDLTINFDAISNGHNAGASASINPMFLVASYCIHELLSRQLAMIHNQQRHFENSYQPQGFQQQQQQQRTYNITRESLNSMISQVNDGILEQQRRSMADIDNPTPSTSAAAAAAAAAGTPVNPNLHQQEEHQHQLLFTLRSNNSSGYSSGTSSFGERTPNGTPSSGDQMITTRNVAAQLFNAMDFAGLDLSLNYFQQNPSSSTHCNNQQQSQHPPNPFHQPLPQQSQRQHRNHNPPQPNQQGLRPRRSQTPPPPQFRKPPVFIHTPGVRMYPMYFFEIEVNGHPVGKFILEVYRNVVPRMAKNFHALVKHDFGYGYKGCKIFQCWENASIITGDFEFNNGRGGHSIFNNGYFMPDAATIAATRGCVGMRRTQKRHDNPGAVGSQFRIILRDMRGFTGIFGRIVEGIELVAKIAKSGDSTGTPSHTIVIVNCGEYQRN